MDELSDAGKRANMEYFYAIGRVKEANELASYFYHQGDKARTLEAVAEGWKALELSLANNALLSRIIERATELHNG